MADPFTLTAISIGTAVVGAGVSAYGAMKGGKAQNAMYQYQAGVAKRNAEIAKQNATYELQVGEVEAQRVGMKSRATQGAIVSKQSGSNLDVNSGTNVNVRDSAAMLGKHDQDTTRSNAARRAYGYELEALRDTTQAELYKLSGKNAEDAGELGMWSSLLSGASNVSGKWLQAGQAGIGGGKSGHWGYRGSYA